MKDSIRKILLPLKLGFQPAGCILVGDVIKIKGLGNTNSKLAISTPRCVFTADFEPNQHNGKILKRNLSTKSVEGKVYAIFSKHIIVEVSLGDNWFQVCDYRNPYVVENQQYN
jgi:hypothetical protein